MKNTIIAAGLLFFHMYAGLAEARSIIFYADSALIELDANTVKGVIEIPLPADIIEDSLRIKPLGTVELKQVNVVHAKGDTAKAQKEYETLLEQKHRLLDKLQALETREKIFTAAAKSQSGKAIRKTRTNPDPLQAIRQGTDFAMNQLEAVYTSRRKTEQELKKIDAKIADAQRESTSGGSIARITLAKPRGVVVVTYVLRDVHWTPRYDFRLNNAPTAQIGLSAVVPAGFGGYKRFTSAANRNDAGTVISVPVTSNETVLAHYDMPVSEQFFEPTGQTGFAFVLNNNQKQYLPPGESTIYQKGEYIGKVRFEGLSSGRSRKISR